MTTILVNKAKGVNTMKRQSIIVMILVVGLLLASQMALTGCPAPIRPEPLAPTWCTELGGTWDPATQTCIVKSAPARMMGFSGFYY